MMNLNQLQALVTDERVKLSVHDKIFYATVVEENGDEHELAWSTDIGDLHQQLRDAGVATA